MKRATLAVLALLALGPSVKADPTIIIYQATSGTIAVIPSSATFSFSGNGFTVHGEGEAAACPGVYILSGGIATITPCGPPLSIFAADGSGVVNGIDYPFLNFESSVTITANPMLLSGATQATLSEPVMITGGVNFCPGLLQCPGVNYTLLVNSPGTFNINLYLSGSAEEGTLGYYVASESYIFATPEPGTLLLMGAGLLGLVFVGRRAVPVRPPPRITLL